MTPDPETPAAPVRGRADGLFARPLTWLGLAVLLALIDFVTPPVLLVPIFFPIPSVLAAWHRRRGWAAALVVGMTAVALANQLLSSDTWGVGPAWVNAAVRLVAYSAFALLTGHAARLRDDLADPDAVPAHSDGALPAVLGSPVVWALLSVVLMAADYLTGPEVLVSVLFLFPVLLAGWHRRLGWATGLAASMVLVRLALELRYRDVWLPWSNVLNAAFRLLMLGVAAYVANMAAYLTLEAVDRVGDAEGHSVELEIDPEALRAATSARGAKAAPPPPYHARTRLGAIYESLAVVGIGMTVVWDAFKSKAVAGPANTGGREKAPAGRPE